MNVVAASPAPANAKPISTAAGSASTAHHERDQPEDQHRQQERGRVDRAADQRPRDLARARRRRRSSGVASIAS